MADDAVLAGAARDVYAAPPGEFVSTRAARVEQLKGEGRADEARAVGRFRKPTAGADLVNRLVAHDGDLADDLADLGHRLRRASASAEAADLRAVDQERRAFVARCGDRAREVAEAAGTSATAATLHDVEQTIWAALVDAHAGATVLAGALVRALSPGGFGEVDLSGASAVAIDAPPDDAPPRRRPTSARTSSTSSPPTAGGQDLPSRAEKRAADEKREAARRAVQDAQGAHEQAQRDLERAVEAADAAQQRRDGLDDQRSEAQRHLAELDTALREAKSDASTANGVVRDAERARRTAAASLDRAVRRAEDVDRGR